MRSVPDYAVTNDCRNAKDATTMPETTLGFRRTARQQYSSVGHPPRLRWRHRPCAQIAVGAPMRALSAVAARTYPLRCS